MPEVEIVEGGLKTPVPEHVETVVVERPETVQPVAVKPVVPVYPRKQARN